MNHIEAMKQALEALEPQQEHHRTFKLEVAHTLRQAIAEAEKQEPVAWRNAAIRIGEELSSVGPNGYYDMTAQQWIDWAMEQEPKGKTSLPQPKHEWVGLTDEEFDFLVPYCHNEFDLNDYKEFARAIEAKLKEKNT